MSKLRVSADAPASGLTVGPITGPDWKPGEERELADCLAFDPDRNAFAAIDEACARRIADASGGVVAFVPDPDPAPAAKRGTPKED